MPRLTAVSRRVAIGRCGAAPGLRQGQRSARRDLLGDLPARVVPTVNGPAAVAAATAAVGSDRVDGACAPVLASEDFALLARQVPGCLTFVGNGVDPEPGGVPLHSGGYDFNDDIISTGVAFYVELVRSVLPASE